MRSILRLSLALLLAGCATPDPPPASGPLARHAEAVAASSGVPRDLLLAIAHVEGGLLLPRVREVREEDHVPVGGILELRHGAFDSLARGAQLLGVPEEALRADTDLGTEAGARVLAELGAQTGATPQDLASWRTAVDRLSGLPDSRYRDQYLAQVFSTLREGGLFPARDGERVYIAPHPEIPEETIGVLHQELGGPPADYGGATWMAINCANKCTAGRPDGNGSVDTIVIHDTEGGWAGSIATLSDPNRQASVHYIIDADGSRVVQFLHEIDTGWHAGNWCYNKRSIGIEHVGMAADPAGYKTSLYQESAKLVKSIRSRWKVPLDRAHIIGHYQIPDGTRIPECSPPCSQHISICEKHVDYGGSANHWDPGFNWQWCQYMELLGGSCTCNDAYSLWNCTTDKTEAVRCNNNQVEIAKCMPCESQPNGVNDICHMAVQPDLATLPDLAGPTDGGMLPRDGATPFTDGSTSGDAGSGMSSGGCHCQIGGPTRDRTPLVLALVLLLLVPLRRRFR